MRLLMQMAADFHIISSQLFLLQTLLQGATQFLQNCKHTAIFKMQLS
jgi:hypothetical protein